MGVAVGPVHPVIPGWKVYLEFDLNLIGCSALLVDLRDDAIRKFAGDLLLDHVGVGATLDNVLKFDVVDRSRSVVLHNVFDCH